jgi:MFS family permease
MTHELAEGFVYLKSTPSISIIMLMMALVSLMVLPYNTLLPVFAKVIFKGDAATFGYINSFIGLGAISGSIFLAALKKDADLKIVLLINSIVFGVSLLLFSYSNYFPVAMLCATISGFGMMSQTTIFMTIIQINSAKNMRGRVMSYVAMAYFGMLPLGSLLIGAISSKIGAPKTIFCEGIVAIIIVFCFANFLRSDQKNKKEISAIAAEITSENNN